MFNIGNSVFIQDIFYYIVVIFCMLLLKADFVLTIIAQVSDVTLGPLFLKFLTQICMHNLIERVITRKKVTFICFQCHIAMYF